MLRQIEASEQGFDVEKGMYLLGSLNDAMAVRLEVAQYVENGHIGKLEIQTSLQRAGAIVDDIKNGIQDYLVTEATLSQRYTIVQDFGGAGPIS